MFHTIHLVTRMKHAINCKSCDNNSRHAIFMITLCRYSRTIPCTFYKRDKSTCRTMPFSCFLSHRFPITLVQHTPTNKVKPC